MLAPKTPLPWAGARPGPECAGSVMSRTLAPATTTLHDGGGLGCAGSVMTRQTACGLDSQYRRTRSPSHEEGDAMYEEIRTQSTALTLPNDHEDEVEALVDLVQDLTDQNSQLSELVTLL